MERVGSSLRWSLRKTTESEAKEDMPALEMV